MVKKEIVIPIYDFRIILILSDDFGYDVKNEANYNEDTNGASAVTLTYPDHVNLLSIVFDRENISSGGVAHEALHATNKIMVSLGIKPDLNNDEAQCYLLGFIVDCIYNIIDNESND